MSKTISFIIPAYNSEAYIEKNINSFLDENLLEEIEVIVVNDGSTDSTPELVQKYIEKYPDTVKLCSKENGGHGSAINVGVLQVNGKYFKVIDADDWVLTENLSQYILELKNAEADVVLTSTNTYNISTKEYGLWKCNLSDYEKIYTLADAEADWSCMEQCLNFHGITYRTDFYKQKGTRLAEHVFYEDHQYATIPCCYAEEIKVLDLVVYVYRIGDVSQSISDENQYRRHSHFEEVIRQMSVYLCDSNLQGAGRFYFVEKLSRLVITYLAIMLLSGKDIRSCRKTVKKQMKQLPEEIFAKCKKRYVILLLMNRLHISKKTFTKLLNSNFYRKYKNKFTKRERAMQ